MKEAAAHHNTPREPESGNSSQSWTDAVLRMGATQPKVAAPQGGHTTLPEAFSTENSSTSHSETSEDDGKTNCELRQASAKTSYALFVDALARADEEAPTETPRSPAEVQGSVYVSIVDFAKFVSRIKDLESDDPGGYQQGFSLKYASEDNKLETFCHQQKLSQLVETGDTPAIFDKLPPKLLTLCSWLPKLG